MTDNSRCGTLVFSNRSGAMVMRLVPQEELLSEQEIRELEAQGELEAGGRVRDDSEELNEAQLDGAVTDQVTDEADAGDSAGESNGENAAAEPAVSLAMLEALLLSTHHPLTAGRLAELLDLDSTKPVRKA